MILKISFTVHIHGLLKKKPKNNICIIFSEHKAIILTKLHLINTEKCVGYKTMKNQASHDF